MLAPDIGRERAQEGLAHLPVAGAGPGLDPGGALPVLAAALVIGQSRVERNGDGGRAGVRAQAQVGAEDIAMRLPVLHQRDELLHHAGVETGCLGRVGQDALFQIIEGDDVDVGRVVELLPAMLAQREDGEAGIGRGRLGNGDSQLALLGRLAHQQVQRGLERGVGEV
ncbi:hypothetical protein D3C72_1945460 [compost metagenome]